MGIFGGNCNGRKNERGEWKRVKGVFYTDLKGQDGGVFVTSDDLVSGIRCNVGV